MELTYKDFKVGQVVTCVKFDDNDFWDQHLTVGKKYKVEDVDFHFPDKIAIRSDNKKVTFFVTIEFFADIKYERKLKLNKIHNEKK